MSLESIDMIETEKMPSNPFPGLRPFEFDEYHLYFGRDGQSEQLLRKLGQTRFVAVVGTSGSGKSSLVRAGLLPALYGGLMTSAGSNWRVALMRPGNDPIGNLAQALNVPAVFGSEIAENAELQTTITEVTLRRGSLGLVEATRQTRMPAQDNLLVVVDQFEELFRFAQVTESAQYQNDAAAFVKLLLEAAHQRELAIYVVLTLRSDFLGDCSLFWDLPEAINEGQYLIPRLTREQRREAITGPVAVGGGDITPRLVNRLLNDMGDNPDQLPILQHALMRTWDKWKEVRRGDEPIDLEHYEMTGGMAEALSRHADEAYNELPDDRSRLIAEKIFKALTEKGADNREIRRPVELKELCALTAATEAEAIAVIELFRREGRSFLMPPFNVPLGQDSLIDISHESLIRNWQRLNEWVDQEARSARIYRRLAETAALYEKREAGLWRDPDLQLALIWREESKPNKAWARRYHTGYESAMSFLDQSRASREAEIVENERKRKREIKRARLTALVFGLAFILALAALFFAYNQKVKAATALNELRANQVELELKTQEALLQSRIAKSNEEKATLAAANEKIAAEKEKKAAADALEKKKEAELAKAQAEQQTLIATKNEGIARDAQRGAQLATASEQATALKARRLLYDSNLILAQQSYEAGDGTRAIALLNNPLLLQADKGDPRGFEWSYLSGLYNRKLASFEASETLVTSTAFSPDGKLLATGSGGKFKLWDAATRTLLAAFDDENKDSPTLTSALAFSPDGKMLATASAGGNFKLWDTKSHELLATLDKTQPFDLHPAIAFSPDGRMLATGVSQAYKLWDISTTSQKKLIAQFHQEDTTSGEAALAFSHDGNILALYKGFNIELWDINAAPQPKLLTSYRSDSIRSMGSMIFSPDDQRLTFSTDEVVETFSVKDRSVVSSFTVLKKIERLVGDSSNAIIAFSPDGQTYAVGMIGRVAYGGEVQLREAGSNKLLATFPGVGSEGLVAALAFSSDGKTLAIGGDKNVQLNDATPQRHSTVMAQDGAITFMAVSQDGKKFAIGNEAVNLLEADSLDNLTPEPFYVSGCKALSPDGNTLATCTESAVQLWDIASHRQTTTIGLPQREEEKEADGKQIKPMSVAFSPDGRTIAIGVNDEEMQWWDVAGRRLDDKHSRLFTNPIAASVVVFSPDGKLLAALNDAYQGVGFEIWDTVSRRRLGVMRYQEEHNFPVSVAFSADSKLLALGLANWKAEVWDIASMTKERNVEKEQSWDLAGDSMRKRFMVATLGGHAGAILSLAFSPDNKTLATGSEDMTVRLWSRNSFEHLLTLDVKIGNVYSVSFSPDSRTLLAGGATGIELWRAPVKTPQQAASK